MMTSRIYLQLIALFCLFCASKAFYIPESKRESIGSLHSRMFGHGGLRPTLGLEPSTYAVNLTGRAVKPSNSSANSSLPNFVVYSDRWTSNVGPPPVSEVKGFNVVALAFLLVKGPFDKSLEWVNMSPAQRNSTKKTYHSKGIKLIVSAFGSTDTPTTDGVDPIATANKMAEFVIQYGLDGIDVDYEDYEAINKGDGKGEAWVISFTKQLRAKLPKGKYILTHAPVAPWFSPGRFGGGAYLTVHKEVGDLIDWYNIQFYNQGSSEYTTCEGLVFQSSPSWPQSSLLEIAHNGVPMHKIVIGKPGKADDASNGFMSTNTLAGCLNQAKKQGWKGGAMTWEYPDANTTWINHVRAQAFPESAS